MTVMERQSATSPLGDYGSKGQHTDVDTLSLSAPLFRFQSVP